MIKTEDEKLVQLIAEELLKKDTILYIGSGVSCWSGLPSWSKLLKDLSAYVTEMGYPNEHINKAINNGKFLYAASLSKKQLTSQEYAYFLKKEMDNETFQPSKLHEAIVQLGCNNYVTTNYDKLLEKTLRLRGREIQVISNKNIVELPMINRLDACNYILKSHGDIDDIESIILTREDYAKLYQDTSNIAQTLKTLFLTRTVIFVGFGLNDPDFDYIRDHITNTYGCKQIVHYAIMPDMEEEEKRYWKEQYSIKVLAYHTTKEELKQEHGELLRLIKKIGEIVQNYKITHNSVDGDISEPAFQLSLIKYLSKMERENSYGNTYPIGVREIHNKNHSCFSIIFAYDSVEALTVLNYLENLDIPSNLLPNAIVLYSKRTIIFQATDSNIEGFPSNDFNKYVMLNCGEETLAVFIGLLINFTRYSLLWVADVPKEINKALERILDDNIRNKSIKEISVLTNK